MTTELITVLDVDLREQALHIINECAECGWFKIGSQLFTRCGPEIVRDVQDLHKDVMLDLKLHDIPNTVNRAGRAAADMGVSMFTIHALGGKRMIAAAREAVEDSATRILAVTVLTSHTESILREELGIAESPEEAVRRLAAMAVEAGAHGIVCSPREISLVRDTVGGEPTIVTPGVRPSWAGADDQERITTPREAARAGANYIVVGRPILNHEDPAKAVQLIQKELA